MAENILIEIDNNIAKIEFNRPHKKNALTLEMLEQLCEIGDSLKNNDAIRCVIINGAGENFCSGIDTKNFSILASDEKLLKSLMSPIKGKPYNKLQKPSIIWSELKVPVIAVLEGVAFGAGLQIALGADIRIASESATLSIMETRWGLIPDMGISQHLPKLVSYDTAITMTITSELIDAKKAKAIGLITHCAKNPFSASIKLAKQMLQKSPDAIALAKALYQTAWNNRTSKTLKFEASLQTRLIGSRNQLEAAFANIEKRRPNFEQGKKLYEN